MSETKDHLKENQIEYFSILLGSAPRHKYTLWMRKYVYLVWDQKSKITEVNPNTF